MAALNDQANQDKGFIRMQNQVESVTNFFLMYCIYWWNESICLVPATFAVNSVTSFLSKKKFLIFFQR